MLPAFSNASLTATLGGRSALVMLPSRSRTGTIAGCSVRQSVELQQDETRTAKARKQTSLGWRASRAVLSSSAGIDEGALYRRKESRFREMTPRAATRIQPAQPGRQLTTAVRCRSSSKRGPRARLTAVHAITLAAAPWRRTTTEQDRCCCEHAAKIPSVRRGIRHFCRSSVGTVRPLRCLHCRAGGDPCCALG
jgi:hypothetical protein